MTQASRQICLLIGVGNRFRHDDGVGLFISQRVRRRTAGRCGWLVLEQSGDATALMDAWQGAEIVMLVDAVSCGSPPGTIHRFEAHRQPVPAELFACSTHAFGVAHAIELSRSLGRLPARLVLWGIEAESFEPGIGLTTRVMQAACQLAEQFASAAFASASK